MSFTSAKYDEYVAPLTSKYVKHLLNAVATNSNSDRDEELLDVGSGTGCAIKICKERGYTYVGVDNDASMVKLITDSGEAAFTHDCASLPINWTGRFHSVISNFGAIFSTSFETSIEEMARCCHIGGAISLSCWAGPEKCEVFHLFGGALEIVTGTRPNKGRVPVETVENTMKQCAGLSDVKREEVCEYLETSSKDWLWMRFTETSNKLREIIEGLSEDDRRRVKEIVFENIEKIGEVVEGVGYRFPVTAYVVSAKKEMK